MGSWRIPYDIVYNIVGSFAEFIRIPKAGLDWQDSLGSWIILYDLVYDTLGSFPRLIEIP